MTFLSRATLAAGLLMSAALPVFAQGTTQNEVLRSLADGFPIHITYYPALEEKAKSGVQEAPVVILVHDENESRLRWDKASGPRGANPFPVELQERGYAVITVDLRKHGESKPPGDDSKPVTADFAAMPAGDMGAVKKFIYDEHQKKKLNMRKLGVVALGAGAAVACAFAEIDWRLVPYDDAPIPAQRTPRGQDVRALVLVSPKDAIGAVNGAKSLNFLRNPNFGIGLMVICGEEDTEHVRDAKKMHQSFARNKQNEPRTVLLMPKVKDAGLALFVRHEQLAYIPALKFLDEQVKEAKFPWADRRSRLER